MEEERTAAALPGSDRAGVLDYAAARYGTKPEYLWQDHPGDAVLRHPENRKWYGILMDVPREKLGLPGPGRVELLEVKADAASGGSVLGQPGILPAYHMAKGRWLTVLLDGTVPPALVFLLLDSSFAATAPAGQRRRAPRDREVWVMPSNPRHFDLEAAFAADPVLRWQQRVKAAAGDIVYLYVTAPVCAVLYRCRVVRTDIPWHYDDGYIRADRWMELERLDSYAPRFPPAGEAAGLRRGDGAGAAAYAPPAGVPAGSGPDAVKKSRRPLAQRGGTWYTELHKNNGTRKSRRSYRARGFFYLSPFRRFL